MCILRKMYEKINFDERKPNKNNMSHTDQPNESKQRWLDWETLLPRH